MNHKRQSQERKTGLLRLADGQGLLEYGIETMTQPARIQVGAAALILSVIFIFDTLTWSMLGLFIFSGGSFEFQIFPCLIAVLVGLLVAAAVLVYERGIITADTESLGIKRLAVSSAIRIVIILCSALFTAQALEHQVFRKPIQRIQYKRRVLEYALSRIGELRRAKDEAYAQPGSGAFNVQQGKMDEEEDAKIHATREGKQPVLTAAIAERRATEAGAQRELREAKATLNRLEEDLRKLQKGQSDRGVAGKTIADGSSHPQVESAANNTQANTPNGGSLAVERPGIEKPAVEKPAGGPKEATDPNFLKLRQQIEQAKLQVAKAEEKVNIAAGKVRSAEIDAKENKTAIDKSAEKMAADKTRQEKGRSQIIGREDLERLRTEILRLWEGEDDAGVLSVHAPDFLEDFQDLACILNGCALVADVVGKTDDASTNLEMLAEVGIRDGSEASRKVEMITANRAYLSVIGFAMVIPFLSLLLKIVQPAPLAYYYSSFRQAARGNQDAIAIEQMRYLDKEQHRKRFQESSTPMLQTRANGQSASQRVPPISSRGNGPSSNAGISSGASGGSQGNHSNGKNGLPQADHLPSSEGGSSFPSPT